MLSDLNAKRTELLEELKTFNSQRAQVLSLVLLNEKLIAADEKKIAEENKKLLAAERLEKRKKKLANDGVESQTSDVSNDFNEEESSNAETSEPNDNAVTDNESTM